jgi:hypothetical protein
MESPYGVIGVVHRFMQICQNAPFFKTGMNGILCHSRGRDCFTIRHPGQAL